MLSYLEKNKMIAEIEIVPRRTRLRKSSSQMAWKNWKGKNSIFTLHEKQAK